MYIQVTKDSSMGDCSQSGEKQEFEDPNDKKKVFMYPCGLVAQVLMCATIVCCNSLLLQCCGSVLQ